MHKPVDSAFFASRSLAPVFNAWNGAAGFFLQDTLSPSDPSHFTEGTPRQYRWMLPHAPEVLAELLGGEKAARELLHEYFFVDEPSQKKDDTNQCGNLHSHSMGNEPAMHVPYLFSLFGYPEDTQNIVSIARNSTGGGGGRIHR